MRSAAWQQAVLAANSVRRVVRRPSMLFPTLVLPFLIIGIVGIALGGSADRLSMGVVAPAGDELADDVVRTLQRTPSIDVTTFPSQASLEAALRRGQLAGGTVLPSGYGDSVRAGEPVEISFLTTPDQRRTAALRVELQRAVGASSAVWQAARLSHEQTGRPVEAEAARGADLLEEIPSPQVVTQTLGGDRAEPLGFAYTAPSNLVLFIVITSLTSAATLVESRRRGVPSRVLAMPVRRWTLVSGELLGRFSIAALQAAVIVVVSAVLFGVDWGDPAGLVLLTGGFCLFGAALGMLVGFGARTPSQAASFGPPLGIVLGMLGGCMWPLSVVGDTLRTVGHLTPHAWAMDGYIELVSGGAGVAAVVPQVLAVMAFAAGTAALAVLLIARREHPL